MNNLRAKRCLLCHEGRAEDPTLPLLDPPQVVKVGDTPIRVRRCCPQCWTRYSASRAPIAIPMTLYSRRGI